jgi:hypothetical protein
MKQTPPPPSVRGDNIKRVTKYCFGFSLTKISSPKPEGQFQLKLIYLILIAMPTIMVLNSKV